MDEELKNALNKMYQSNKESEIRTAGYTIMALGASLLVAGKNLNNFPTLLSGIIELIGCLFIVYFLDSWEAKRKTLFD